MKKKITKAQAKATISRLPITKKKRAPNRAKLDDAKSRKLGQLMAKIHKILSAA